MKLGELLACPKTAEVLEASYHFTPISYYALSNQHIFCDSFVQTALLNAKHHTDKIQSLTEELQQCESHLKKLQEQVTYLSSSLNTITNSTSWKITAPLRHALNKLRKNF